MTWRKIFRRGFIALIVMIFALNASIACAEVYIGEGSYVMSKVETLEVARERAKADAMRSASEQAGVYVKSYSRSRNFDLEEDIIETMTASIIKLVGNPHFYPLETVDNLEGVLIRVTVNVQINDSDINRWLSKSEQEKSELVAQMEALRKANEEQARQIAELKRQLAQSTTKAEKERITNEFANADKIFLSNQKVDEGWKLWDKKDFNGAAKIFEEAIQLNPNNSDAWRGRGTALNDSRQYERAIQDFNKALELNPKFDYAYNNRGVAYMDGLKQYERAIQDFNKAIELNPKYDYAYNNRGWAYYCMKQYKNALKDFEKALELNPNYTTAKNNREACLKAMGK